MKRKLGFTIIEVSLFLAVSALLFVGIAAGTGVNVARQRYNNAVQDYTEFLRRLYSQTEDTQNELKNNDRERITGCTLASADISKTSNNHDYTSRHTNAIGSQAANTNQETSGRTNCAIYGKIAVFNAELDTKDNGADTDNIMVYDVIGDIIDNEHELPASAKGNTIDALYAVHAGFLAYEATDGNNAECKIAYAGGAYSYTPDWGSYIETTPEKSNRRWSGAVMVVRSPIDGVMHTYTLNLNDVSFRIGDPVRLNPDEGKDRCSSASRAIQAARDKKAYLSDYLDKSNNSLPHFTDATPTNFCVNSPDSYAYGGLRRNVRLKPDGSDSAAVELIELNSGKYDAKTNPGGNACES